MTVEKKQNGEEVTLLVSGRVDTTNANEFESEVVVKMEGAKSLVLDFAELEYISSAGLRVILNIIKQMKNQGTLAVKNANEMIKEIFEVTGFSDLVDME